MPVQVEVHIPFEFHRFIIGQQGKEVRSLMKEFLVNITVPPSEEQSNIIVVNGVCAREGGREGGKKKEGGREGGRGRE